MRLYSVSIASMYPNAEIGIVVRADGTATNRFADGIAGVPKAWKQEAEEMFDPMCDPEIGSEDDS